MSRVGGSDLFISKDLPPSMNTQGTMRPMTSQKLSGEFTRQLAHALMNQRQRDECAKEFECNFAISLPEVARFRINVFVQPQIVRREVIHVICDRPHNYRHWRWSAALIDALSPNPDALRHCGSPLVLIILRSSKRCTRMEDF